MIEIDVTHLYKGDQSKSYSASIAEIGQDAGRVTWNNAKRTAADRPLLTEEQIPDAREYFAEFGAWSREELEAMPSDEINALTLQYVSGDIRERKHYRTWAEYEEASHNGRVSGQLYRGDDGRIYFLMSH